MNLKKVKLSDILKLFRGKQRPPRKARIRSEEEIEKELAEDAAYWAKPDVLTPEEKKLKQKLRLDEPSEDDLEKEFQEWIKGN